MARCVHVFSLCSSSWLGEAPIVRHCRIAKVEKFTSDSHAKKMNPLIRAPQGEIAALRTTIYAGKHADLGVASRRALIHYLID